ncbi:MAG: hypothetical protein ABFD89_26085 [Bryobacteraceae bacterium]
MRKLMIVLTALILVAVSASAEGLPSSKATADVNTLVKCTMSTATVDDATAVIPDHCYDLYTGASVATNGAWIDIMSQKVKLSNSQSLFVSPSLVTGLYTRTRTKTVTGDSSTAEAMGGVYLRAVLVPDAGGAEIVAAPLSMCGTNILGCVSSGSPSKWGIILDSRVQTLTQSLSECTVMVGDLTGTCSFTSIIDLVLKTTSAHTFNFIFPEVGQGTYTLVIKAAVASGASIIDGSGTAVGAAAFGVGSVLAESVRLVHDFEF